jgi:transcription antitermination factor NusG
MHTNNSFIISHSIKEDNDRQKSRLSFRQGDVVSVEFDPFAGKIKYGKEGSFATFVQATGIKTTTKDPLNFCVLLHNDEVSII